MKKIIALVVVIILVLSLVGCNQQVIDTTWKFERAIVYLPNGEIVEGQVDSWKDFENSDQIQVKIDGKTYLTHAENIVLISE